MENCIYREELKLHSAASGYGFTEMIKYVFKMSITGPSLIKCEVTLTGHIQLSSHKPLNLASAQVTVLDRVERTDPAQSLLRHSGPEGSAARDGKLLQRRAV